MQLPSGGPPPDPRWVRLLPLGGAVACALVLPLAMASAGPAGGEGPPAARSLTSAGDGTDPKAPSAAPSPAPGLLGLGLATAVRCGPELSSPEGVEAQTCVLTQGQDTWARTYYRNATGRALEAVLSLMGPRERTVQMRCAVDAEDEPDTCETPRERTLGALDAYTAIAEFSTVGGAAGEGPLLLRSGSNSATDDGS
ncbi:hypothetical protein ACFY30_22935 [Streptomyces sp. NPDC000345]|uniref:hypothetical protein n=1 Tax=Streptomyces sp. NPDC000345 TaxID=3364537 RepID=UPI0036A831C5